MAARKKEGPPPVVAPRGEWRRNVPREYLTADGEAVVGNPRIVQLDGEFHITRERKSFPPEWFNARTWLWEFSPGPGRAFDSLSKLLEKRIRSAVWPPRPEPVPGPAASGDRGLAKGFAGLLERKIRLLPPCEAKSSLADASIAVDADSQWYVTREDVLIRSIGGPFALEKALEGDVERNRIVVAEGAQLAHIDEEVALIAVRRREGDSRSGFLLLMLLAENRLG